MCNPNKNKLIPFSIFFMEMYDHLLNFKKYILINIYLSVFVVNRIFY